MRKEYNDRHLAPLVNPGITLKEYEAQRALDSEKMRGGFENMLSDRETLSSFSDYLLQKRLKENNMDKN